jgi:histidine triad (HIT) family protein
MEDSIFTKIIKGEIPAHKIYEDEHTLAFLDIHGTVPGHTLVISKVQVEHLWDLGDEDYFAVMETSRKVARHLRATLSPTRVGVKIIGESVPHVHVHLIPFTTVEEYNSSPDLSSEPDHEALAEMAKKLAF